MEQITRIAAEQAEALTLAAAGLAIIALLIAFITFLRMRLVTRPLASVRKHGADGESVLSAVVSAVENNALKIEALGRNFNELAERHRSSLQYCGLVRYDAFDDIAGQQSYSLCLLDGNKDGVLLSYITGRNSARSYTVSITGGVPSRKLGDEEARAMDDALSAASSAG